MTTEEGPSPTWRPETWPFSMWMMERSGSWAVRSWMTTSQLGPNCAAKAAAICLSILARFWSRGGTPFRGPGARSDRSIIPVSGGDCKDFSKNLSG